MFDKEGRLIPDETPVEVPLAFRRPPTLQEQIQRMVRIEMSQQAAAAGLETFEEADDFEVDEDPDPLTADELRDMVEEVPIERESKDASSTGKVDAVGSQAVEGERRAVDEGVRSGVQGGEGSASASSSVVRSDAASNVGPRGSGQ